MMRECNKEIVPTRQTGIKKESYINLIYAILDNRCSNQLAY